MKTAYLIREAASMSTTETLGWLYINGTSFPTLELPWRDNERRVSCIPPGTYTCVFLPESGSGKYLRVYHVTDVPGRAEILIHPANTHKDLLGCIAPGMKHGELGGERAVLRSRTAMAEIVRMMDGQDFMLEIK